MKKLIKRVASYISRLSDEDAAIRAVQKELSKMATLPDVKLSSPPIVAAPDPRSGITEWHVDKRRSVYVYRVNWKARTDGIPSSQVSGKCVVRMPEEVLSFAQTIEVRSMIMKRAQLEGLNIVARSLQVTLELLRTESEYA